MFAPGGFNQTGGGFAADAFFLRGVGAIKNVIDAAAVVPDFRCHGGVDGVEGRLGYQAAMEGGLIGDDNGSEAASGQFLNSGQTAGQKFELSW
jgi:hypothetical protein